MIMTNLRGQISNHLDNPFSEMAEYESDCLVHKANPGAFKVKHGMPLSIFDSSEHRAADTGGRHLSVQQIAHTGRGIL